MRFYHRLQVENQYKIDNVIRQNLLGQDDALAAIAAHEDFFDYLLSDFDIKLGEFNKGKGADTYPDGGVFGTLFEDKLYNEEALAPGDLGMLFQYNKLVGGVLITQTRSRTKPCPPSAYSLFYNKCYDTGEMVTAEPCRAKPHQYSDCKLVRQNTTRAEKKCGADDEKMQLDTSQTKLYAQLQADINASKFGDRDSLAKKNKIVQESFEYRYEQEGGYAAWLSLADGPELNRQKIVALRDEMWLDLYTRKVEVKFIFYNGNMGTFSFVAIRFTFNTFGMYQSFNPDNSAVQKRGKGGSRIEIGSLNMEPYITHEDYSRLVIEIVFMIFVFNYAASLIFDVALAVYKSYCDGSLQELFKFVKLYGAIYLCMDVANISCHVAFVWYRLEIISHTICNPVRVPTPNYNPIFEELTQFTKKQLAINFWSILFGNLRFFKYYQFQPRLQIVNKTLSSSAIHLFHFMFLFLIIHVTFSMIGHLNFGTQNRDFSTLPNAIQVMAEAFLGGAFDLGPVVGNNSIAYSDALVANLFFQLWAFLVQMILLNIFVAILMDGYAEAQEEGASNAARMGLESPESILADINT
jgi:hypothetical protein